MDRRVALLNIRHFKEKLETTVDESERTKLKALLKEEEAKLAAILESRRGDSSSDRRKG